VRKTPEEKTEGRKGFHQMQIWLLWKGRK